MARKVLNIGYAHDGQGNNLHNAIADLNVMLEEIYGILENQYTFWTSTTTDFRMGVRDGKLSLDHTLTANKWEGTEGVDWENIWQES